ncbi:hypothetical protein ABIA33_005073 [Streptacidiphilus sp. MAP12-16]
MTLKLQLSAGDGVIGTQAGLKSQDTCEEDVGTIPRPHRHLADDLEAALP